MTLNGQKIPLSLIKTSYILKITRSICYELYVQCLEKLQEAHNNLPVLPARMKIEKVETLVASLPDKTEYFIHIRNKNKH